MAEILLSDINVTTFSTITYLEFFPVFHKTARKQGFKIKAAEGKSFSRSTRQSAEGKPAGFTLANSSQNQWTVLPARSSTSSKAMPGFFGKNQK